MDKDTREHLIKAIARGDFEIVSQHQLRLQGRAFYAETFLDLLKFTSHPNNAKGYDHVVLSGELEKIFEDIEEERKLRGESEKLQTTGGD